MSQNEANMAAPEPTYAVSEAALIQKYRGQLDEANFRKLLAEAAVDELLVKVQRLQAELREVEAQRAQQEQNHKEELEQIRGEIAQLAREE